MSRRSGAILLAVTIPVFGGVAYAAANSIDTRPAPQVIVPPADDDTVHHGVDGDRDVDDASVATTTHAASQTTAHRHEDTSSSGRSGRGRSATSTPSSRDDPSGATSTTSTSEDRVTSTTGSAPSRSASDDAATRQVVDDHGHGG